MLLPKKNRPDLSEVPARLRKRLDFIFVDSMDQVLPVALLPPSEDKARRVVQ
jgi:ATP-dependent Lon protease